MSANYLVHHGIKGQKWGIRRFQNEDGSLTSAGERRYGNPTSINPGPNKLPKTSNGGINPGHSVLRNTPDIRMREHASRLKERIKERNDSGSKTNVKQKRTSEQKKALAKKIAIGIGAATLTAAAAYAVKEGIANKRVHQFMNDNNLMFMTESDIKAFRRAHNLW